MHLISIITITLIYLSQTNAVRLHKLFQFVDGFKSEHNLRGFLHLGVDYSIFLRVPKPHDRFLIYELYESKKTNDDSVFQPKILAISKVPLEYVKEQLKIFRDELYKAKYIDENVVPGTRVKTLREWQIEKALNQRENEVVILDDKPNVLRTILN